jgi:CBS domain-containing protein
VADRSRENTVKVGDVMTRSVATVHPETPLKDVAALMVERGISGVPVVDADGSVLGIVSEADFVIKERGVVADRNRLLARVFGKSSKERAELAKIEATTAGEAMTSPALTVGATDTLQWAAEQMASRRVNRLPVVEEGRLVGIVTRADLVRAYVRPDAELERLVREEVLAKTAFALEPDAFEVVVQGGVVRFAGRVDRRSLAETIVEVTHGLGGIVGVESHLTWEFDDVYRPAGPGEPEVLMTLRPH